MFLINTEKAYDKIQYPILIKTLSKLQIEGNFLKLIKNICEKLIASIFNEDSVFPLYDKEQEKDILTTSI